jgi:hypothetical protein
MQPVHRSGVIRNTFMDGSHPLRIVFHDRGQDTKVEVARPIGEGHRAPIAASFL